MRTPNTKCTLCNKPLYRRPYELKQVRYFACKVCRAKAQSVYGVTDRQRAALDLRHVPGIDNGKRGLKQTAQTKAKMSKSALAFARKHPEIKKQAGLKTRGALNYNWKGGTSRITLSIRNLPEMVIWARRVKARDKRCMKCGNEKQLEAHHKFTLQSIINVFLIKTTDDARKCSMLWDLNNGVTLCKKCHFTEHGRTYNGN